MDGKAEAYNERVIMPSGVSQRTMFEAINPYPNFMYVTQIFITVPTTACHLSLSWAKSKSTRSILGFRSILTSFFHLRLDHPSGLFPKVSPTKHRMHFHFSPTRTTCLTHLFLRINSLSHNYRRKLTFYSLRQKCVHSYTCTVHLLSFCTMTNKMHNYFTNYHTPTCFDTIVSSSDSL